MTARVFPGRRLQPADQTRIADPVPAGQEAHRQSTLSHGQHASVRSPRVGGRRTSTEGHDPGPPGPPRWCRTWETQTRSAGPRSAMTPGRFGRGGCEPVPEPRRLGPLCCGAASSVGFPSNAVTYAAGNASASITAATPGPDPTSTTRPTGSPTSGLSQSIACRTQGAPTSPSRTSASSCSVQSGCPLCSWVAFWGCSWRCGIRPVCRADVKQITKWLTGPIR